MDNQEAKQICYDAVQRYGKDAQIDMAIEECSELIQALCKNKRGRDNRENIIEELADVYIMLEQLLIIFDINHGDEVSPVVVLKLKKMLDRWEAEACSTSE